MTLDRFLQLLAETPREDWALRNGTIALVGMFGFDSFKFSKVLCAELPTDLGMGAMLFMLSSADTAALWFAAQGRQGELRARLLAACGLAEGQ